MRGHFKCEDVKVWQRQVLPVKNEVLRLHFSTLNSEEIKIKSY